MEYVDKSGVAALKGIHRTGQLDDDGLPELAWYGAKVDSLTYAKLIGATLNALAFPELDRAERTAIVEMICEKAGGKPFQRAAIRRIVRSHRG